MVGRQLRSLLPQLLAATRATASSGSALYQTPQALSVASKLFSGLFVSGHQYHSSASCQASGSDISKPSPAPELYEPQRKYRSLADKELWHEAWMYEDRFGTEDQPVIVPSLEPERIIGCTDPEDDNLVVWGILREGEGPRQFIEGGEYYVLKKVPYIAKVGDVLEQIEASKVKTPIPN